MLGNLFRGEGMSWRWNSWDNCSTLGDAVGSHGTHALLDGSGSVSG